MFTWGPETRLIASGESIRKFLHVFIIHCIFIFFVQKRVRYLEMDIMVLALNRTAEEYKVCY